MSEKFFIVARTTDYVTGNCILSPAGCFSGFSTKAKAKAELEKMHIEYARPLIVKAQTWQDALAKRERQSGGREIR